MRTTSQASVSIRDRDSFIAQSEVRMMRGAWRSDLGEVTIGVHHDQQIMSLCAILNTAMAFAGESMPQG
jgi:hypothetical protein